MTLRHLEIFMAVCRAMSMSKAAENLGMSQPAVSRAVAELEAFYNVRLFDRLNRRIYLSEAGASLLRYAEVILSQFDESVSFLRDENAFSTCRLCVNVTVGETILGSLIQAIGKQLPSLQLSVGIHNSKRIEEMLISNACDLAVMDEKDDSRFDTFFLYEERLGFFVSPQYHIPPQINPEDLITHRLLLRESGSGSREKADLLLHGYGYPGSEIWESSSGKAIIQLAQNGFGIALLPVSCISKSDQLREISVNGISLSRRFSLVSLRNKYLSTHIRSCMEIIRTYCETSLQQKTSA